MLAQTMSLYDQSIELFNEGEFYECDQIWSDLFWQAHMVNRGFYQGLIEVAGALFRLMENHYEGFFTLMDAGMESLTAYPPVYHDLDLGLFIKQLHDFRDALASQLKAGPVDPHTLKIPKLSKINRNRIFLDTAGPF